MSNALQMVLTLQALEGSTPSLTFSWLGLLLGGGVAFQLLQSGDLQEEQRPDDLPGPETQVQVLTVLELSSHLSFSLSLLLLGLITPGDCRDYLSKGLHCQSPTHQPYPQPSACMPPPKHIHICSYLLTSA